MRDLILRWLSSVVLAVYGGVMGLLRPLVWRKLHRRARQEALYGHDIPARWGRYGGAPLVPRADAPLVWIHAVSLGETRVAAVLIAALRQQHPTLRILLTHSTATGWAEGQQHLREGDVQTWLPWDDSWSVRRFLRHFQPRLGVLMETEVWPQLVAQCQRAGVPLVLANARLNEGSWRKAERLWWLSRPAYAGLTAVWAQTEDDAQRLRSLGAKVEAVWGNLKFDAQPNATQCASGHAMRLQLARPLILLASAREGEELEFLTKIKVLALKNKEISAIECIANCQYLIVPRHPQRFDEVAQLIAAQGWRCRRRADWGCEVQNATDEPTIWLGDSLGEMAFYYSMADVALLGGSFAPLGGQNLIEAAACACPLVLGPHTFNFAQAAAQAVATGAALRVSDLSAALQAAHRLLTDPSALSHARAQALHFARSQQGGTAATAQQVLALCVKNNETI
jgi:3-deoxy-D-manno-octulosonic-acid transferase